PPLRPPPTSPLFPCTTLFRSGTLGAGMVLGREGPTVQLGGNVGRMVGDLFRMRSAEARHTLLATGAAAGLSAAFNAPLAGILFIDRKSTRLNSSHVKISYAVF